jgi:hypothetical protein
MSAVVDGTVLPGFGSGCSVQRVLGSVPSTGGAGEVGLAAERRALMPDVGATGGAMILTVRTVRADME